MAEPMLQRFVIEWKCLRTRHSGTEPVYATDREEALFNFRQSQPNKHIIAINHAVK